MNEGKLYCVTTKGFKLPLHSAGGYPAHDLPQLLWPDGTVCWLANLYLINGYKRGMSRKNKGGTLLVWAKHLSHLIRWCYLNKVDFIDLTDSHFSMFIGALKVEKDQERPSEKKREDTQVANICSTVMNFLAFLDKRYPGLDLIGPDRQVKAELKAFEFTSKAGKKIKRTSWVHEDVPKSRKTRRRQPISTAAVERLYEANEAIDAPRFVSRRRFIMLRLLEITGGRRIEVSQIKVKDVEDAQKTGELKLFSAKQEDGDAERFVPVTRGDLKEILSFVSHYRNRVVLKTIGKANDHDFLFVGMHTGKPLKIDTHGTEFYILRKAAGIDDEEACLHVFRHRFITNIFRNLIRTHLCQNEKDLKNVFLSKETLMAKVMEWTGHSSVESLNHYIHLAFEAESNFHTTLDLLKAKNVVDSLDVMLTDYTRRMQKSKPSKEMIVSLTEIVSAAASELHELFKRVKASEQESEALAES